MKPVAKDIAAIVVPSGSNRRGKNRELYLYQCSCKNEGGIRRRIIIIIALLEKK